MLAITVMKRSIISSIVLSTIENELSSFPVSESAENTLMVATRSCYDDIGCTIISKCLKTTGISKCYMKERNKYVAVVHCSSSVSLGIPLRLVLELLMPYNNLPLYALIENEYYPILYTDSEEEYRPDFCDPYPNKVYVVLHTGKQRDNAPVKIDLNGKKYLVIEIWTYKDYYPSKHYYACESFESANNLLKQRAAYYKEKYDTVLRYTNLPTEDSNTWGVDFDKLGIGMRIIDIETMELAAPPLNLA